MHLLLIYNTTDSVGDRLQLWSNGVRVTAFSLDAQPTENQALTHWTSSGVAQYIGAQSTATRYFDGYLAEVIGLDGVSAVSTDFGEFDINENWVPIDPSGLTFGTNGYWLDFADSSDIGNNANSTDGTNDWTPSGLAAGDITTDSPTDDADNSVGNYATLNPLSAEGAVTFSEGNLKIAGKSASYSMYLSTLPIKVKTYFEVTNNGDSSANGVRGSAGVWDSDGITFTTLASSIGSRDNVYGLSEADRAYADKVGGTDYTGTWDSGETRGFAVDPDTGEMWVTTDGGSNWLGGSSPGSGTPTVDFSDATGDIFATGIGYTTSDIQTWNFGQTVFDAVGKGGVPSGYLPLHTGNLPAPAIPDSSAGFNLVDFTGTAAELSVAFGGNTALSPDMVLVRDRSDNFDWEMVDTTRGATIEMKWNANAGDATVAQGVKSFTSDGVTLGTDVGYNTDGSSNMLLGFKEGAAYGFDMALWEGDGAASQDVDHSLDVTPEFIVACRRDGTEANRAWHSALTNDTYSVLWNDPGYGAQAVASFAATHGPDTFGVDGQHNIDSETYIAYLWASINGFSKFGKYTGNGSADGTFIYCGFRPKALFIRRYTGNYGTFFYNTTSDPYNVGTTANVFIDDGPEQTSLQLLDITANGFKWRQAAGDQNGLNGLFMWGAWAEAPFGGEGVSQARAR